MTVTIEYPKKPEGWFQENPKLWSKKEVEIDPKTILSIEPQKWGDKIGMRVYILPEGLTSSHWHFVTSTMKFLR